MSKAVQKTRIQVDDDVAVYVWCEKAPWTGNTWVIQVDVVVAESDNQAHARVETSREPNAGTLGKTAADIYMAWREAR